MSLIPSSSERMTDAQVSEIMAALSVEEANRQERAAEVLADLAAAGQLEHLEDLAERVERLLGVMDGAAGSVRALWPQVNDEVARLTKLDDEHVGDALYGQLFGRFFETSFELADSIAAAVQNESEVAR